MSGRICSAERFRAHSEFKSWNELLNIFRSIFFYFKVPKICGRWSLTNGAGMIHAWQHRASSKSWTQSIPSRVGRWEVSKQTCEKDVENVNLRMFHWLVQPVWFQVWNFDCSYFEVWRCSYAMEMPFYGQARASLGSDTSTQIELLSSIPRLVWDQQSSCRGRSPTPCGGTSLGGGWSKMIKWRDATRFYK